MIHGYLQQIDQPLYDTLYTLAPRSRQRRDREKLFCIPFGQLHESKLGLRVKTFEDTNMLQSGCLDSPKSFIVRNIRVALLGRRLFSGDSRYYRDLWVDLSVCAKRLWSGPAWRCLDPATMVVNPNAWLSLQSDDRTELIRLLRKSIDPPIELRAQEPFDVTVTFGEAWFEAWYAAPEKLVVLLEGLLSVAVI
jgi:hypothetical protein